MTKAYRITNKKNEIVYYAVTAEMVIEMEKKIARYGWKVEENETGNGEGRDREVWNEGNERENWAV